MTITPGADALERIKIGVEAALELSIEDLENAAVHDAPIDEGILRDSSITDTQGFGTGNHAWAELRFTVEYAAAQHEGRYTRNGRVVTWERPRRAGKLHYVSDNVKAKTPGFVDFVEAAAKHSAEAG
jgi:hypothetical protein